MGGGGPAVSLPVATQGVTVLFSRTQNARRCTVEGEHHQQLLTIIASAVNRRYVQPTLFDQVG